MTVQLIRGANTSLQTPQGDDLRAVLLEIGWDNPKVEVSLFAILCGSNRLVRGEGDFLYWDQPVAAGNEVFLLEGRESTVSTDEHSQVVIDLTGMAADVERVSVAIGTTQGNAKLQELGALRVRAIDAHTAVTVAEYENSHGYGDETCAVICDVYRRQEKWKLKAVDQGWSGGVPALACSFGIDVS